MKENEVYQQKMRKMQRKGNDGIIQQRWTNTQNKHNEGLHVFAKDPPGIWL